METLIKEGDFVLYQFKIIRVNGSLISLNVFKVISWNNVNNEVCETEFYLGASIKWNGCCNINFGDDEYIYLCGKKDFENHKKVMDSIIEVARQNIENWDESKWD